QRARSGEGQYIEVPMFETMANFVLADHLGAESFAPALGAAGNPRLLSRYRKPYQTSDGWLSTILYTDRHWAAFLQLVGHGALWEEDPRFRSMASRTQNVDAVYAFVEQQIVLQSTAHWLEALSGIDVPVARVADITTLASELAA